MLFFCQKHLAGQIELWALGSPALNYMFCITAVLQLYSTNLLLNIRPINLLYVQAC